MGPERKRLSWKYVSCTWRMTLILLLGLGVVGCGLFDRRPEGIILARAYKNYLTLDDLDGLVPAGSSPADSLQMIRRYVDNWVRQQVYLHEATSALPPEQMDFDKTLEDYKNSLIIHAFETDLIRQHLDTQVTQEQIAAYYEEFKHNFILKDPVVQVVFLKIPLEAPAIREIRSLVRNPVAESLEQLEEYALEHAASFFTDTQTWLYFNDLRREIPIPPGVAESFLAQHSFYETTDEFYRYFLRITDYLLPGDISPLEFERDNIRHVLLNRRKHALVREQRQSFFQEALRSGNFEVYY